jgi:transcriptional regulator with XRE-family HTH domain
MWRDNILRYMEQYGVSSKQLAERSGVSENTIKRIKKDPNATIQLATLDRIALGLGIKTEDITNDTNAIIGTVKLEVLQEELSKLKDDFNLLVKEKNLLESENKTLLGRLELAETKLLYTEKLLLVYEKFDKLK